MRSTYAEKSTNDSKFHLDISASYCTSERDVCIGDPFLRNAPPLRGNPSAGNLPKSTAQALRRIASGLTASQEGTQEWASSNSKDRIASSLY